MILYAHGPSSGVQRHVRLGSQLNAISLPSYSCGAFHTMRYKKSRIARLLSVIVPHFRVRPTTLRWALPQNPVDHET